MILDKAVRYTIRITQKIEQYIDVQGHSRSSTFVAIESKAHI